MLMKSPDFQWLNVDRYEVDNALFEYLADKKICSFTKKVHLTGGLFEY